MTAFDFVILGVIGLSTLFSLLRGFVREVLALAGWVAAIWVALAFSGVLAGVFEPFIEAPALRSGAAFVTLFVLTLLGSAIVGLLVGKLVKVSGLGGTDRMLGLLFGALRGALIVTVLVLLGGLAELTQEGWWKESLLIGYFEPLALWLREFLPADLAGHFKV